MKLKKDKNMKHWRAVTLSGCLIALFYVIITHLNIVLDSFLTFASFFTPVILALIIAYVVDPLVKLFQSTLLMKLKETHPTLNRIFGVVLAEIVIIAMFAILLVALIPQMVDSVITFTKNLGNYIESLQLLLAGLGANASSLNIDISNVISVTNLLLNRLLGIVPSDMGSVMSASTSIGASALNWVIAYILSIYFLLDKTHLVSGMRRLMSLALTPKKYAQSTAFWNRCNSIMTRYIICELVDALIVGVANYIFMMIAGLPYALMISVVVGVTNLAPTFGPIVGAIIGAFFLLLVSPWYSLWFLIFTIIIQTVDGYIIKPKMYGGALSVPSIVILIAIIVGGRMFGVVGILLAIPAAGIIDYLYDEAFIPYLKRRKRHREEDAKRLELKLAERRAAKLSESSESSETPEARDVSAEFETSDSPVNSAAKAAPDTNND